MLSIVAALSAISCGRVKTDADDDCTGAACDPASSAFGGSSGESGRADEGGGPGGGSGGTGGTDGGRGPVGGSDGPGGCPAIACGAAMRATLPVELPWQVIRTLTLETCWNGTCFTLPLDFESEPTADTGYSRAAPDPSSRDGSPWLEATIWAREAGGYRLEVDWWPLAATDLADGDEYRIRLVDALSRVLLAHQETAVYDGLHPSPEPCALNCPMMEIATGTLRNELWSSDEPAQCPLTPSATPSPCTETVACWYRDAVAANEPLLVRCDLGEPPRVFYGMGAESATLPSTCDPVGTWQLTFLEDGAQENYCGNQLRGTVSVEVAAAPDGTLVIDGLGRELSFEPAACRLSASWDYEWTNPSETGYFSAELSFSFAADAGAGTYSYADEGFCGEYGTASVDVARR